MGDPAPDRHVDRSAAAVAVLDNRGVSEGEMQSKRFVQLGDEVLVEDSDPGADSPDVHGSDLLGLCLAVSVEPGCRCIEQHLEGVDPGDPRAHSSSAGLRGGGTRTPPSTGRDEAVRRYRVNQLDGRLAVDVDDVRSELRGCDLAGCCALRCPMSR